MALNKISDNNVINPLTLSTLRVDGTFTSSGTAIFTGGSQSTVGLISRQSQTTTGTDLQQWQQGDGFVWGRVTSQGEFQFGANGSTVRLGTNTGGAAALVVSSTSTAQVGAIIKGSAGITADIFQIQNSAGTSLSFIDSSGNFRGAASGHQYRATNEDSTRVKFANWYSSDSDQFGQGQNWNELWFGAINASTARRIGFYLNLPNATLTPGATNANMYITPTGVGINIASASVTSQLHVASGAADRIVQIIRGFGTGGSYTQSTDLQQWQSFDGTTATTIAKVASNGVIFGAEVRTLNTQAVLREVAGGGNIYLAKATSAPSNPGAGIGTLFYRDGTTAGTLKLATRTGASGVEETVVDNISSTGSTAGAQFVGAGGVNTIGAVTTGAALNLNYASPTIASNNASAASIFTATVTGVTIGSSTIRTTEFPADGTTSTATAGAGYMGMPQNSTTSGAYTVAASDAGKHLYSANTRTVTINSNTNLALPVGTTVTFISGPGATTTIAITSDTMYLAGTGTTGSRTLAAFGMATAVKTGTTTWFISGNGLT